MMTYEKWLFFSHWWQVTFWDPWVVNYAPGKLFMNRKTNFFPIRVHDMMVTWNKSIVNCGFIWLFMLSLWHGHEIKIQFLYQVSILTLGYWGRGEGRSMVNLGYGQLSFCCSLNGKAIYLKYKMWAPGWCSESIFMLFLPVSFRIVFTTIMLT